jgi:predicted secreted hydrolase
LPRDDAPHDRLTEWWYYTGHLSGDDGSRFGFEFVIFRAERGGFPVTWASHFAITDEGNQRFHYAQRTSFGPQVSVSGPDQPGFALTIPDDGGGSPWQMTGSDGVDRLAVALGSQEAVAAGLGGEPTLELDLRATKPPALHDTDGWIDFGGGGSSYYYSRTSMAATGELRLNGQATRVSGIAWFDHQWGDFIAVGGGGWDWFAVNLEDGTDLTLSLVRDADGSYPLVYGTLVDTAGRTSHLLRDAFSVEVTDRWTSPSTGADYPAGWRIRIPGEGLIVDLTPSVPDQELDTRATTGVVYWEGSQVVRARRGEQPVDGEAYVELTGYGPAGTGGP